MNATIDKAEREAETEYKETQGEAEYKQPDWSTLDPKNLEQTRALRKKVELQQKLKAKRAAEKEPLTEQEELEIKENQAKLAAEAIKTIEDANAEKPKSLAPKVKLAGKVMVTNENTMSQEEKMRLGSAVGAGKAGKCKVYFKKENENIVIEETDVADDEVVSFSGCKNCEYTIKGRCTKVFVEHCEDFTLRVDGQILTHTIEVDACERMNLVIDSKIGTLQVERCTKTNIFIKDKVHFTGFMIWAGSFMLRLQVEEAVMSCDFGLTQKMDPTINIERTQFKVWMNNVGKLSCDKIIRLENGFPSTKREDDEHIRREEGKLDELSKRMGVTVNRKADAIGSRVKPNETCPCGSGQKYKKCCQNGSSKMGVGTTVAAQESADVADDN